MIALILFVSFIAYLATILIIERINNPSAGMSEAEILFGVEASIRQVSSHSNNSWGGGMDYSFYEVSVLPKNVAARFEEWDDTAEKDGNTSQAAISNFPILPDFRNDHKLYTRQPSPLPENLNEHVNYALPNFIGRPRRTEPRLALGKNGSFCAMYSKRSSGGVFSHIIFFVVDLENNLLYRFGGSI